MKPIAIIPARGGSKRIPRKNITPICGMPALGRTIHVIKGSNACSEIVVSTDDEEIAQIAIKYGAKVFSRSLPRLSDDLTPTEEVIRSYILESGNVVSPTPILCVYPLSVLLEPNQIDEAIHTLSNNPDKFVIAAGLVQPNPLRHTFYLRDHELEVVHPENNERRSQDLENVYFDAGMFYLATSDVWLDSTKYWYHNNARVIHIPSEDAIDVDTPEDLKRLNQRFKEKIKN